MTLDDPTSLAKEALADLGKRIKHEEAKAHERIDRARHFARSYEEADDQARQIWREFHMAIEPMQREQEYILRQLVQIEACKTPGPMIIPKR